MPPYAIFSSLKEIRTKPARLQRPRLTSQQRPWKPETRFVPSLLRYQDPRCSLRRDPAGGTCTPTEGSPNRTFRSPEVLPSPGVRPAVPEAKASRVLSRALRKTSPASAADMASEFLALPEYTLWEGTAGFYTTQPLGRVCPSRGGVLGSGRAGLGRSGRS